MGDVSLTNFAWMLRSEVETYVTMEVVNWDASHIAARMSKDPTAQNALGWVTERSCVQSSKAKAGCGELQEASNGLRSRVQLQTPPEIASRLLEDRGILFPGPVLQEDTTNLREH